jgi:hypothetical protein
MGSADDATEDGVQNYRIVTIGNTPAMSRMVSITAGFSA